MPDQPDDRKSLFLYEDKRGVHVTHPRDGTHEVHYGYASIPGRTIIGIVCDFWKKMATLAGYIIVPFRGARAVWMRPYDYKENHDQES